MTKILFIKQESSLHEKSIHSTLQLLDEECSIPFIARYRKDKTGNLDEVQIETIAKLNKLYNDIDKRKNFIIDSIDEQNGLTSDLKTRIQNSFSLQELEDLYLPFKRKRKTKADAARLLGLEPLAKLIMAQHNEDIGNQASRFVSKEVLDSDEALQGARDIIAEWISETILVRNKLRYLYSKTAVIMSKASKTKMEDDVAKKYEQYFDWSEPLARIPSHRLLAILRAESEGVIKFKIDVDNDRALDSIAQTVIKKNNSSTMHIRLAIKDSFKRLLDPALSNEVLQQAKLQADKKAIQIFVENLKQLLLASPLGQKRILAIDPGFKTGCKVVCLDEKGDLMHNETLYPNAPQHDSAMAMKKIRSMINAYNIDAISIGNGTASRETEFFIKKIAFDRPIQVFIVSEAGASIYSASKVAREEFGNYDVTVRGAVSIGRRLADPLAELVKIDPKSIGVGQYQHDVDQALLKDELDSTVVYCVNSVGINLNTASKSLLSYVSGIGERLADNIISYRSDRGPFKSRKELLDVPRLGDKAFQQAAGFLRVIDSSNPLDNSSVHPESYSIVELMAKHLKVAVSDLVSNSELIAKIDPNIYVSEKVGLIGINDILKELEKPGVDPRKASRVFEFDPNIRKIEDLKTGMHLPGIVNNITAFGCFVDIGIKESGLVHISQLKEGFVSDVSEVVRLHQPVKVKVVEVDVQRKRINLSMILD